VTELVGEDKFEEMEELLSLLSIMSGLERADKSESASRSLEIESSARDGGGRLSG
jgi:hypothetical protein